MAHDRIEMAGDRPKHGARPGSDRARLARAVLQILGRAAPADLVAALPDARGGSPPDDTPAPNPPVEPTLLRRAVLELQRELESRRGAARSGPQGARDGRPHATAGAGAGQAGAKRPVPAPVPGAGAPVDVPEDTEPGHRALRAGTRPRQARRPVNLADEHPLAIAQALAGRPATEIGSVLSRLEPRKSRAVALYLVRGRGTAEPAATDNA